MESLGVKIQQLTNEKCLLSDELKGAAVVVSAMTDERDRWKVRAEAFEKMIRRNGYLCQLCVHEHACAQNGDKCGHRTYEHWKYDEGRAAIMAAAELVK